MAIITPNQIGSRPIDKSTGPIKGTTIKVISIKSRINPRRNISSSMASKRSAFELDLVVSLIHISEPTRPY